MFYLNSIPNKKGERLIYLQFNYNRRRVKIYLPVSIHPDHWDAAKQRPKRSFKLSPQYNRLLDKYEATVNQVYLELIVDGVPNKYALLEAIRARLDPPKEQSVYEFALEYATRRRSKGRKLNIVEIIKAYDPGMRFEQIDTDLMGDFASYLQSRYAPATAAKYYQLFKEILNDALDKGILTHMKHKTKKVSIKIVESTAIFLTLDELEQMYAATIPDHLVKYRDLFLVMAYTGVRFSDLQQISKASFSNIEGKQHFRITDKKENNVAHIPAHPIVLDILRRNGWKLPEVSNVKLNLYIKEVGRLAKIDQNIIVTTFPKGVRKVEQLPKYKMITCHSGRRSLISNLKISGMDDRSIMAISGHRSESAYRKYLRLVPSDYLSIAFKSDFFKVNKLKII